MTESGLRMQHSYTSSRNVGMQPSNSIDTLAQNNNSRAVTNLGRDGNNNQFSLPQIQQVRGVNDYASKNLHTARAKQYNDYTQNEKPYINTKNKKALLNVHKSLNSLGRATRIELDPRASNHSNLSQYRQ
jgi:hypothetical protein